MLSLIAKVLVSAVLVVIVSEVSKRTTYVGGMIASLPVVSILAMIWLYNDERDVTKVSGLATSTFWFVLPSLVLFILLPVFLKKQLGFSLSLSLAAAATMLSYLAMIGIFKLIGYKL